MNYNKHLKEFFDKAANDKTLNATHVSLYITLLQLWGDNQFKNPIRISESKVMQNSKINSKIVYYKSLKKLNCNGYIKYLASCNPSQKSYVFFFNTIPHVLPVLKNNIMASSTVQKNHNLKGINFIATKQHNNKFKIGVLSQKVINNRNANNNIKSITVHEKIRTNKMEESKNNNQIPEFVNVLVHFIENEYAVSEAQKFYNYYVCKGWIIEEKATKGDWKIAANNWMIKTALLNSKLKNKGEPPITND